MKIAAEAVCIDYVHLSIAILPSKGILVEIIGDTTDEAIQKCIKGQTEESRKENAEGMI